MSKFVCLLWLLISYVAASSQIRDSLTASDKIYRLSKFWQEVNYNFVYLNKVDRQMWDKAYKTSIESVQRTRNDYEYYRELQKFCALLKDGHTNVTIPQHASMEQMTTMFGDYRIFVENIDGKAIIVRTNQSKKEEVPIGSEIIEVNGMPTQDYLQQKVVPYISSSTDYVLKDQSINRLLQGLKGDAYQIKIKTNKGKIISLSLTHALTSDEAVYPPFDKDRKVAEFKWLGNQIAYVGLNSFESVDAFNLFKTYLPELYKAKSLIIDLRLNGGGNTDVGAGILQYLVADSVPLRCAKQQ